MWPLLVSARPSARRWPLSSFGSSEHITCVDIKGPSSPDVHVSVSPQVSLFSHPLWASSSKQSNPHPQIWNPWLRRSHLHLIQFQFNYLQICAIITAFYISMYPLHIESWQLSPLVQGHWLHGQMSYLCFYPSIGHHAMSKFLSHL